MPKISVITPTVRHDGLPLVAKALSRQTFKEFEWLIVSPTRPQRLFVANRYIQDPPLTPGDYWTLNKAYNKALQKARGELIVSWQDYTYAKPDALAKFWTHYNLDKKKIVSGVGNKYEDNEFIIEKWRDPRMREDQGTFYPCYWMDIEWNFCAVPKKAIQAVGGFDDRMDKAAGLDALSVNERINDLGGYDFHIDQTNQSYSREHSRLKDWAKKNALNGFYEERKEELKQLGLWPVLKTP